MSRMCDRIVWHLRAAEKDEFRSRVTLLPAELPDMTTACT